MGDVQGGGASLLGVLGHGKNHNHDYFGQYLFIYLSVYLIWSAITLDIPDAFV